MVIVYDNAWKLNLISLFPIAHNYVPPFPVHGYQFLKAFGQRFAFPTQGALITSLTYSAFRFVIT